MVFVGIGGIGMSALARHFLHQGKPVFGYDKVRTDLTLALEQEGAIIVYNEDLHAYPGWTAEETTVIFTPAIPATNAWLQFFQSYQPIKRAQALAIAANEGRALAVAGTHGKTSTSALLTHLLVEGGMDPTAFVGGIMTNSGTNYRLGSGPWVVLEADEFDRSFLHLHPEAAAITTTDADHLDIYGKAEALDDAFTAFTAQVSGPTFTATSVPGSTIVGIPGSTAWTSEIEAFDGAFHFTLNIGDETVRTHLKMPGRHNVYNALLAACLANHAGMTLQEIGEALPKFKGIRRRFEYHLEDPVVLIEDYAHHPTELKALLDSVEELYPEARVCICFQPHLFSRTRDFMPGFIEQLRRAKQCILLPIYPARELPIAGITSEALAQDIPCSFVVQPENLLEAVEAANPDVILIVGAGDIGNLIPTLKSHFA